MRKKIINHYNFSSSAGITNIPQLYLLQKLLCKCRGNRTYKDGLKPIKSRNNQFDPQTALDYCDSLSRSPQPWSSLVNTLSIKSLLLLKLGREKEAAAMLIQILQTRGDKTDDISMSIKKNLAIAYLRLGERNNCINNHSDASCIMPIQGKGIYTDPSATQKGIEIYEQILQKDSTDLESRWLLNIAYMVIGEYPSKVPQRWLIAGLDTDSSSQKSESFPGSGRGSWHRWSPEFGRRSYRRRF